MYNYYELRNALQGNFYDIYYKQKVYSDKESVVKKYEKNISIYVQQVCPVIPLYDRIASFHYDSSRRPLEKKWYHFFTTDFSKQIVTVCHSDIFCKYFSSYKGKSDCYLLIFYESILNQNSKLLHYIFQKHLPNLNPDAFVVMKEENQVHIETEVYTDKLIQPLVAEIDDLKTNFVKYKLQGLQPRYFPQFFHSGVLSDCYKIQDGIDCGEISLLYNCGKSLREKCHQKQIFSFRDERFLDQLTSRMKPIVQRILTVNSKNFPDWKIIDKELYQNQDFIQSQRAHEENKIYYIDLEFTNKKMYLCGFYDNHNEFEYIWEPYCNKTFMMKLISFLQDHSDCIFIYYSAEVKKIKEYIRKLNLVVEDTFFDKFKDLYVFLSKYTAFSDCYDYKLKTITKGFQKKGKLTSGYEEGECQSGTESIEIFENYLLFKNTDDQTKIIDYNKLDCFHQKIIFEELLSS